MRKNETIDKIKDRIYPSTQIPAPIMKFINSLDQFGFEVVMADKPILTNTPYDKMIRQLETAIKVLDSIEELTARWKNEYNIRGAEGDT